MEDLKNHHWTCSFYLIHEYSTETIKVVIIAMTIPPKEDIAIGTIISDPRPSDLVRTIIFQILAKFK